MLISSADLDSPTLQISVEGEKIVADRNSMENSRPIASAPRDFSKTDSAALSPGQTIVAKGNDLSSSTLLKEIQRLSAASKPKALPLGYEIILLERGNLLKKKYGEGLSQSEARRLRFLQWQVSIIEDAQMEDDLQELEGLVERVEQIAGRVDENVSSYKAAHPAAFRKRRKSK